MRRALLLIILLVAAPLAAASNPQDPHLFLLRDALALGIARNFNLRVDALNVPSRRHDVTAADAAFDPALESTFYTREAEVLSGAVLYEDAYQYNKETGADLSLRKRFKIGLRSRLTFRSTRLKENSLADSLNPEYQNFLILNLTQPLLRDFGAQINTAQLQISENQVEAALYDYLDQVQETAARLEKAYFDLAQAQAILALRSQSQNLARELLAANRQRLKQGVIAISEVQQAETALAARDEDVIVARQQVEMEGNRLKDLLEIRAGDPLHAVPLATEPLPAVDIVYPAQEEALSLALKQRLDLQRLYLTVENQKIRLAFSQNQKLPRLDLGATFGINGLAGEDRPATLFGHQQTSPHTGDYGDAYASMVEDDGYQWALDLKLTYPIGNRAARARHAKLGIEKRQLIYQVKRLEGGIETAVNNSLVIVQRSLERVQVARRFENLARTTLEQEMSRLKEGLSDTFRILNFQEDLVLAHLKRVKATTDFHQGVARLYREMGGNLERYGIIGAVDGHILDESLSSPYPAH